MKEILIIGAGPYGLTTAGEAIHRNIDFEIIGYPMSMWKNHMPRGMILRTGIDEHFDTRGDCTIRRFLQQHSIPENEVQPLPLSRYLEYADWFIHEKNIHIREDTVTRLSEEKGAFTAELESGETVLARRVVAAIGVREFRHIPEDLASTIAEGRYSHSSDHADLSIFEHERVLIIGGRQSAFETAALLSESGARSVHVVCRHPCPRFTDCDFSFMRAITTQVEQDPGWFRNLSRLEAENWNTLAFTEGKLKLEPWLEPRLQRDEVNIIENSNLVAVDEQGSLIASLDNGTRIECDHIIFATGYKPAVEKLAFLQNSGLIERIDIKNGSPVLDLAFQSSVPGLHFLGMLSMADFGFSFGFSTGAITAANVLYSSIFGNRQ